MSVVVVGLSSQPAVREDGHSPALGEDLAVTHRLPEEYHGVTFQRDPGRKTLTLKAEFMDASFEPVSSSNPPAKIWRSGGRPCQRAYGIRLITRRSRKI